MNDLMALKDRAIRLFTENTALLKQRIASDHELISLLQENIAVKNRRIELLEELVSELRKRIERTGA
jgi:SMC interacting uncharacterized protein involved in chromosome segregation